MRSGRPKGCGAYAFKHERKEGISAGPNGTFVAVYPKSITRNRKQCGREWDSVYRRPRACAHSPQGETAAVCVAHRRDAPLDIPRPALSRDSASRRTIV